MGDDAKSIRDISVAIYKMRLEDSSGGGKGAVERMLAKDNDEGQKLRGRAVYYDPLTRAYLRYFRESLSFHTSNETLNWPLDEVT